MHRALALLAGLLLVGQVAAQPVAAADILAANNPSMHQTTPPPPQRPGPVSQPAGDEKAAPPKPDLKAELVQGWWIGSTRYSQFRVTNIGKGTATAVGLQPNFWTANSDGSNSGAAYDGTGKIDVGDLSPGQSLEYQVQCTPALDRVCTMSQLRALSSSDPDTTNNLARDFASRDPMTKGGANIKSVLVKAWWEGNDRHSLFRATNLGNGVAKNIELSGCIHGHGKNGQDPMSLCDSEFTDDLLPGKSVDYKIVCKASPNYVCYSNGFKAHSWTDVDDSDNFVADHY